MLKTFVTVLFATLAMAGSAHAADAANGAKLGSNFQTPDKDRVVFSLHGTCLSEVRVAITADQYFTRWIILQTTDGQYRRLTIFRGYDNGESSPWLQLPAGKECFAQISIVGEPVWKQKPNGEPDSHGGSQITAYGR